MTTHTSVGSPAGLLIASPASGSGKTSLTLGLLVALRTRGVAVRAAKAGPDYIDPAFHAAASGQPSYNLDSWAQGPALFDALVRESGRDAELVLCEALMGLYDGVALPGAWGNGASADIAARTGWPVLLVVDGKGASQSVAALVKGFAHYRDDVRLAGVVLNNVASPRHHALMRDAVEALGIPVLGALARTPTLALPERHLGLVQAGETADLRARLDALGAWVADAVDLDRVLALAAPARRVLPPGQTFPQALAPLGQRIAVAGDAAFSFTYPHLLAGWRAAGAQILPFSPLADEGPDASADALLLPGGYPELHAGRLAAASRFKAGCAALAARGGAVYGECGGYMALGLGLEDAQGQRHAMLGLLGHETSFARRRLHLGYRHLTLLCDTPFGGKDQILRGHEFHYASVSGVGEDQPLFQARAADDSALGDMGGVRGRVMGSFLHLIAAG